MLIRRPNAVDGLAHLGGFAMGILLGTILYPSISETKAHRYTLWAARVVALVLVIVAFALTTKNFCESSSSCCSCAMARAVPARSPRLVVRNLPGTTWTDEPLDR